MSSTLCSRASAISCSYLLILPIHHQIKPPKPPFKPPGPPKSPPNHVNVRLPSQRSMMGKIQAQVRRSPQKNLPKPPSEPQSTAATDKPQTSGTLGALEEDRMQEGQDKTLSQEQEQYFPAEDLQRQVSVSPSETPKTVTRSGRISKRNAPFEEQYTLSKRTKGLTGLYSEWATKDHTTSWRVRAICSKSLRYT